MDDIFDIVEAIAKSVSQNPTGVVGMDIDEGWGASEYACCEGPISMHVSSDSPEEWFRMGISSWVMDAEGNANIVAE